MTYTTEEHAFHYGTKTDSRCPCPALNAMANHGYLPRNGRDIGFMQMVGALREVYNLSFLLALLLTTVGMFTCSPWWPLRWKIDLHDLARHNRIEHNCSLTHADAASGAVFAPNHTSFTLLCRLLRGTKTDTLAIGDFVDARIRRAKEDEHRAPLDWMHREIAHGETALTMLVLGERQMAGDSLNSTIVVPRTFVKQWFGSDRLPDGWKKPEKEVGLWETVGLSATVKQAISAQLHRIALSA
ncbi:Cloroperoxidase [Cytidiella melzeri]|nr:Cloroperoxidase [Cytidiella melzeri]